MRMFAVDGNFTAVHERQKRPEDDVPLSDGLSFMTERSRYLEHLKVGLETQEVIVTTSTLSLLLIFSPYKREESAMSFTLPMTPM